MAGSPHQTTILCLASYFKGNDFLLRANELGYEIVLLTRERCRNDDWPYQILKETLVLSDAANEEDYLPIAADLARRSVLSHVIALEEFDVIAAGRIRELLSIPGLTASESRRFRDKLAMRSVARLAGIAVPDFTLPLNRDVVDSFVDRCTGPWVLKPRSDVSAIGIKKIHGRDELWSVIDEIDRRTEFREWLTNFVLEEYIQGKVFHVDSIVQGGIVQVAVASEYGRPPLDVAQGGGIFVSRTVEHESAHERELLKLNQEVVRALGLTSGVSHAEFIHADRDGKFYFLEIAARVGGAFLANSFEAATGLNIWREWANVVHNDSTSTAAEYSATVKYGGIALSLARQEIPDTSGYIDAEIVYRVNKPHHVGLVVSTNSYSRVCELTDSYARRFAEEFCAILSPRERVE